MSFYQQMEQIIKENGTRGIEHLEFYYGLDLEIHRPTKSDVYNRVHGGNAGGPTNLVKTFTGILHGDDFFPSNDTHSGGFVSGFLYTSESDILVGDTIKIVPVDNKIRRFKIVSKENIGLTTEVFTKWKLSAIGN